VSRTFLAPKQIEPMLCRRCPSISLDITPLHGRTKWQRIGTL